MFIRVCLNQVCLQILFFICSLLVISAIQELQVRWCYLNSHVLVDVMHCLYFAIYSVPSSMCVCIYVCVWRGSCSCYALEVFWGSKSWLKCYFCSSIWDGIPEFCTWSDPRNPEIWFCARNPAVPYVCANIISH